MFSIVERHLWLWLGEITRFSSTSFPVSGAAVIIWFVWQTPKQHAPTCPSTLKWMTISVWKLLPQYCDCYIRETIQGGSKLTWETYIESADSVRWFTESCSKDAIKFVGALLGTMLRVRVRVRVLGITLSKSGRSPWTWVSTPSVLRIPPVTISTARQRTCFSFNEDGKKSTQYGCSEQNWALLVIFY